MEETLIVETVVLPDFEKFRHFLKAQCGIHLAENKQYLVQTRVKQILSSNGFQTLSELIARATSSSELRLQVVDAMTTNETYWLRDNYPFELLKNSLLREVQERRGLSGGKIRIWSAAASSGQEAYSISMCCNEAAGFTMPVEITATDISPTMLEQAKTARYDELAMGRGLPLDYRKRYFRELEDGSWELNADIRRPVSFQILNLMNQFTGLGKFDLIFCRNVLIYFDQDLKLDILRRLHQCLAPGGTLFLGASEGLAGADEYFEMVNCRPGICYVAK